MEDVLIAAILNSRVAETHCRLEAMRTTNLERLAKGKAIAYGEEAFNKLVDETGIHHNAIWTLIQEQRER